MAAKVSDSPEPGSEIHVILVLHPLAANPTIPVHLCVHTLLFIHVCVLFFIFHPPQRHLGRTTSWTDLPDACLFVHVSLLCVRPNRQNNYQTFHPTEYEFGRANRQSPLYKVFYIFCVLISFVCSGFVPMIYECRLHMCPPNTCVH